MSSNPPGTAATNVLITEVSFCALPFDDFEASSWTIRVAWRGPGDRYAVIDRAGLCLSTSGKWHYELQPSSRTDRFKRHHRFPYEQACQLAAKHAPKVRNMGMTAADLPIWRDAIDRGLTREQAYDAVAEVSPGFRRWRDALRARMEAEKSA
jgi:hypothetical protein